MTGYLQAAAPDRYARVQNYGLELEAFTVCAGDEWNPGVPNGDKSKHSERTDFRSKTEDTVGDGKIYSYVIPILIPEDYAEFSPKQTFAQWHEGGVHSNSFVDALERPVRHQRNSASLRYSRHWDRASFGRQPRPEGYQSSAYIRADLVVEAFRWAGGH